MEKTKRYPKVFIIVLNWNGYIDTIECIESLQKLTHTNYEIILLDNGSTDGSQDILRERFKELTFIENGKNLGFAEGNNVGIMHALEAGADYVFLLNNDTTIAHDALDRLVAFAEENKEAGIVGPKILFYDDPETIWFAGGIIDFRKGSSHRGGGQPDYGKFDEVAEVDYITGCALLIKSDVIRKIGLMNPDYFLLFEESDWCLRAKEAGYKLFYVPKARVFHKCSASFGRTSSQNNTRPPSWIYYYVRNSFLLAKSHLVGIKRLRAYFFSLIRSFNWMAWSVSKQRFDRFFAAIAGIIDFFLGRLGRRESFNFRKFWIK